MISESENARVKNEIVLAAETPRAPRRAVVLVAGRGDRLGRRTLELPKCLVEVNGVPILRNMLDRLEKAGVAETVLVVGYLEHVIRRDVGRAVGRMHISYRSNAEFRTTSTSRSLWIGIADCSEDVLVLEGDVYFEQQVIDHFLTAPHADATLVEKWNARLSGSVVRLADDRTVCAWVHAQNRPRWFSADGSYKTVNLHRFCGAFVRDQLRPALAAEIDRGGRQPLESVMASIVAAGGRIHAIDVNGRWCEIDDESDLRWAEAIFNGAADGSR